MLSTLVDAHIYIFGNQEGRADCTSKVMVSAGYRNMICFLWITIWKQVMLRSGLAASRGVERGEAACLVPRGAALTPSNQ